MIEGKAKAKEKKYLETKSLFKELREYFQDMLTLENNIYCSINVQYIFLRDPHGRFTALELLLIRNNLERIETSRLSFTETCSLIKTKHVMLCAHGRAYIYVEIYNPPINFRASISATLRHVVRNHRTVITH